MPFSEKQKLNYPYLTQLERAQEQKRLADLLVKAHADQIHWNLCPKCKTLARTPTAQQCPSCYHRWT